MMAEERCSPKYSTYLFRAPSDSDLNLKWAWPKTEGGLPNLYAFGNTEYIISIS